MTPPFFFSPRPCLLAWSIPLLLISGCTASKDTSSETGETGTTEAWFQTGQAGAVLLGGPGFDNSGGPDALNHPKGIATDGTTLWLADGNNNRVLVWHTLPTTSGQLPDVVLGQPDFESNHSGESATEMKWPVDVSVGGGKAVVADSYNDRLLIWNAVPTTHGQAPDLILEGVQPGDTFPLETPNDRFVWPWGVWTNGEMLIVASTSAGSDSGGVSFDGWVLVFHTFPTESGQAADLVLSAQGKMGTPRSIITDGETFLMVGDHNPREQDVHTGNWVWSTFPTVQDQAPDDFVGDPSGDTIWMAGDVTAAGQLVTIGSGLHVWDDAPHADTTPALTLDTLPWKMRGGDGSAIAIAGDRVFMSDYNAGRVVGFDTLPSQTDDRPNFLFGASQLETDVYKERHFVTNGFPASDGTALLAGDGYDRRLLCWETIPTESGIAPNVKYEFHDGVQNLQVHEGSTWGMGKLGGIRRWDGLPCDGRDPDEVLTDQLGNVPINEIDWFTMDARYWYVLTFDGNLAVWEGRPSEGQAPLFTLFAGQKARLSSDGSTLAIATPDACRLYDVETLSSEATGTLVTIPEASTHLAAVLVSHGHLFLVDHGFHRVYAWKTTDAAWAGTEPDVLLGATDWDDIDPDTTEQGLFWPKTLGFDGRSLWVGEYKFSGRIIGYTPQ